MRVDLDRGTRGGRTELWVVTWCTKEQKYMVMKTTSTKSASTMASQVDSPCSCRARTTRRRQGSAGGQTRIDIGGLTAFASKSSVSHVVRWRARGFDQFGLKTETCLIGLSLKTKGGLGAILVRVKDMWRHLEAYVEAMRSRNGGLSVRCIFLKYGWFYHCVGGYLN